MSWEKAYALAQQFAIEERRKFSVYGYRTRSGWKYSIIGDSLSAKRAWITVR